MDHTGLDRTGGLRSDATFVALRRLGKDVEYRIYDGEDHVLQRKADIRDFSLRRLDFLESHLADDGRPPSDRRSTHGVY